MKLESVRSFASLISCYRFLRNCASASIVAILLTQPITASETTNEFVFLSMWKSEGEQRALEVLSDAAERNGIVWHNNFADGNFNGTRAEFTRLLSKGKKLNAVQWIIGRELNGLIEAGMIQPIKINESRIEELFLSAVHDSIEASAVDQISSLPIAIHTQNHAIFNKRIFTQAGLELPKSLEDLRRAVPVLVEKGLPVLAFSDQLWQVRHLYISLLTTRMSKTEFEDFFHRGVVTKTMVEKLAETFEIIREFTDHKTGDFRSKLWQDATADVVQGRAAFQVLGDYVGAEFTESKHVQCSIIPGANFMLWGADGIAFTHSNFQEDVQTTAIIIEELLKPEFHREYIHRKGGVPVLRGVDSSGFPDCSKQNIADWEGHQDQLVWLDGDTLRTSMEIIGAVAKEFVEDEAMQPDAAAAILLDAIEKSR